MKQGLKLTDFAAEIERQAESKKDYVAPTQALTMQLSPVDAVLEQVDLEGSKKQATASWPNGPVLNFKTNGGTTDFHIRHHAHRHIGTHAGIPATYYDRMLKDAPDLLVRNVNHWLAQSNAKRMVRTLDGHVRALLSDRYRPLDNFDLAQAVLPIIGKEYGMTVDSCAITESRLYIKAFRADMEREVEGSTLVGDIVRAGICISNSEVGDGSLKIEPMIMRLVCTNGQISKDHTLRKTHAGGSQSKGGIQVAQELLRDETRRKADEAFWMSVQDLTRATLDGPVFDQQVKAIEAVVGNKIEGKLDEVVEVTAKKFSLTENEQGGVLTHLIEGGDLSQWGLANAVTRTSQDVDDYDRATDLERMGGEIVELPKLDWEALSSAVKVA